MIKSYKYIHFGILLYDKTIRVNISLFLQIIKWGTYLFKLFSVTWVYISVVFELLCPGNS